MGCARLLSLGLSLLGAGEVLLGVLDALVLGFCVFEDFFLHFVQDLGRGCGGGGHGGGYCGWKWMALRLLKDVRRRGKT